MLVRFVCRSCNKTSDLVIYPDQIEANIKPAFLFDSRQDFIALYICSTYLGRGWWKNEFQQSMLGDHVWSLRNLKIQNTLGLIRAFHDGRIPKELKSGVMVEILWKSLRFKINPSAPDHLLSHLIKIKERSWCNFDYMARWLEPATFWVMSPTSANCSTHSGDFNYYSAFFCYVTY